MLIARSSNFIAISTQIQSNFSTNAGIHDLQLSFCADNLTWRNNITSKIVLSRPICDEIKKSALFRVLRVTFFIPCMSWSLSNCSKSLEKSECGKILGASVLKVSATGKKCHFFVNEIFTCWDKSLREYSFKQKIRRKYWLSRELLGIRIFFLVTYGKWSLSSPTTPD